MESVQLVKISTYAVDHFDKIDYEMFQLSMLLWDHILHLYDKRGKIKVFTGHPNRSLVSRIHIKLFLVRPEHVSRIDLIR